MTVAQMKGRLLATDAEKETHAREAALAWIQRQPKIKATDPSTGEQGEYHVVLYDSPKWYVYDPTRPVMVTIGRTHVYDRSNPSSDELLERPLRNFFVVPDGCYRPWDIHPLAMVKNGRCAVTMLHECFTKQCTKVKVWENGRWKIKTGHKHAMSEEQIEHELDLIFSDLHYSGDAYPFEKGWREDGCTSKMILEFCKRRNIACRIYHDTVRKGNELECFIPARYSAQVNFFIREDHCFWYGKPVENRGGSCKPEANNGISQMWESVEDDKFDMKKFCEQFCDKETMGFFRKADATPPFSEWQHAQVLLDAAPEFEDFKKPPKELHFHGKRVKSYFWHANLPLLEPLLRKKPRAGRLQVRALS